jgi:hypothetical protein
MSKRAEIRVPTLLVRKGHQIPDDVQEWMDIIEDPNKLTMEHMRILLRMSREPIEIQDLSALVINQLGFLAQRHHDNIRIDTTMVIPLEIEETNVRLFVENNIFSSLTILPSVMRHVRIIMKPTKEYLVHIVTIDKAQKCALKTLLLTMKEGADDFEFVSGTYGCSFQCPWDWIA